MQTERPLANSQSSLGGMPPKGWWNYDGKSRLINNFVIRVPRGGKIAIKANAMRITEPTNKKKLVGFCRSIPSLAKAGGGPRNEPNIQLSAEGLIRANFTV